MSKAKDVSVKTGVVGSSASFECWSCGSSTSITKSARYTVFRADAQDLIVPETRTYKCGSTSCGEDNDIELTAGEWQAIG